MSDLKEQLLGCEGSVYAPLLEDPSDDESGFILDNKERKRRLHIQSTPTRNGWQDRIVLVDSSGVTHIHPLASFGHLVYWVATGEMTSQLQGLVIPNEQGSQASTPKPQ